MRVRKRNGRIEEFDETKIANAVRKAYAEVGEDYDPRVLRKVLLWLKRTDPLEIEDIQDTVETVLMQENQTVAKAFILYREQHKRLRDPESLFDASLIDEYMNGKDWRVNENANVTFSLQGLNMYVADKITRLYWLKKIYSSRIARCHLDGDFHLHDLGILAPYCVGWDIADILETGIQGPYDKVQSNPAKHLDSALTHITNFMFTMTTEAAGAQAVSSLDTYLAPFIKADRLNERQVKQEIQKFLFNMAVSTKVGGQVPFTNITLDLKVPRYMESEAAIVGGELVDFTYGDCQEEMNLFNDLLAEGFVQGDAASRPFSFPIPTYNITDGFENFSSKNVWKSTAKFGTPYFANFINSDMKPEDCRSMCCRLRISTAELKKRGGGLFGANPLTGSLGVVTLNMGRLGIVSKDDDAFLENVDYLMDVAKESLVTKRKVLERLIEKGLYPYSKFYLRSVKERTGAYWDNHFSTIGLVGMNEGMQFFMGKGMEDGEAINFSLRVLKLMKKKLLEFQQETGTFWNLEATPAEGCSYSLALKDKAKFGVNLDYYTNSTQLPADCSLDILAMLRLQDPLQTEYTGGTVMHMHLGEANPDPEVLQRLTMKIFSKFKLPYISWIPLFSLCPKHGRLAGHVYKCNTCGGEAYPMTRVVGYLRPVSTFHKGKQAEFRKRKYVSTEEFGCDSK